MDLVDAVHGADESEQNTLDICQGIQKVSVSSRRDARRCAPVETKSTLFSRIEGCIKRFASFSVISETVIFGVHEDE